MTSLTCDQVIFVTVLIITCSGDLKAIQRVTYEFCEDIASQGIVYCEPRYCPQLLTSSGDNESSGRQAVTARDVVVAISKVFEEAEKKFNIKFGSILCCMRNEPGKWRVRVTTPALEGFPEKCLEGEGNYPSSEEFSNEVFGSSG